MHIAKGKKAIIGNEEKENVLMRVTRARERERAVRKREEMARI